MKPAISYPLAAVCVLCSLAVVTWTALVAADKAPPPRPVAAVEERPQDKAKAYRVLFEKVGLSGLPELTKDKDTGLALQASWELHKKIVERTPKKAWHPDEGYDPAEMKKFVEFLKGRTKAPVPDWWETAICDLSVEKRSLCHGYFEIDPDRKELEAVQLGNVVRRVKKGVTLTRDDDNYTYKTGDVTLVVPIPKGPHELFGGDCMIHAGGEKITCLTAYSSVFARSFQLIGFESKSGKRLWDARVWAFARAIHNGPSGGHRAELVVKGDTVFVFGEEVGGCYLEAFDLETGKCRFRFCTNYWINYSEGWNLKPGG